MPPSVPVKFSGEYSTIIWWVVLITWVAHQARHSSTTTHTPKLASPRFIIVKFTYPARIVTDFAGFFIFHLIILSAQAKISPLLLNKTATDFEESYG